MYLEWLEVSGFRCYETLDFRPDPGLNVLVGPNGAGKTSILEAVNYLSALRSFRRTPDTELVRRGDEAAVVRGGFRRASGEVRVEVELPAAGRRRILLNAKRPRRHADVKVEIPMVAFLPDDLDIVKRGPGLRREYLDDIAARLSPQAGADQQDYDKALRQRNALLRRDGRATDRLTLDTYDEQLALVGSEVLLHRLRVMDQITGPLRAAHGTVGGTGSITWSYVSSWTAQRDSLATAGDVATDFVAALGMRRERDLDQKTTTAGPHRDDPSLLLDGRSIRSQASQGEQRSVALSLRVAAYHLLEDRNQAPPMLLLDDVFSELDPERAAGVMELLPRGQVFVTSARDDEVGAAGTHWRVVGGQVQT
jgi:DNA replication and repair protein RecF